MVNILTESIAERWVRDHDGQTHIMVHLLRKVNAAAKDGMDIDRAMKIYFAAMRRHADMSEGTA